MTHKEDRAGHHTHPAPNHFGTNESSPTHRHPLTVSRQIDWFPVYEFVIPLIERLGALPLPGTLPWCDLSDHDPHKPAGVLLAGVLWALNEDARQDASRQAGRDISAAADWDDVARHVRARREPYIPRRSV